MKVITRHVCIESREFVLIRDTQNSRTFYGTIPYDELDSDGRTKRELNGFHMCIGDTIAEAIKRRTQNEKIAKWKNDNPDASDNEMVNYMLTI